MTLSAATTVVGVIGDPIAHSLSPLIHNSGFEHLGLDWVCVAFPTPASATRDAVGGLRALGIAGMSVTMPHKAAVLDSLDEIAPDAALLGAVNCIVNRDGHLLGLNTDGDGFVAGLHQDFSTAPEGMRCAVIGAGGAARSVILALARNGAEQISVVNRTVEKALVAAQLDGRVRVGGTEDITASDLVINATSVGMSGHGTRRDGEGPAPMPCAPELLRPGQYVVDLIYSPLQSAWLKAASRAGATTSNGVSMLVNQAAIAFEAWTEQSAPVEAMSNAVSSHLLNSSG